MGFGGWALADGPGGDRKMTAVRKPNTVSFLIRSVGIWDATAWAEDVLEIGLDFQLGRCLDLIDDLQESFGILRWHRKRCGAA